MDDRENNQNSVSKSEIAAVAITMAMAGACATMRDQNPANETRTETNSCIHKENAHETKTLCQEELLNETYNETKPAATKRRSQRTLITAKTPKNKTNRIRQQRIEQRSVARLNETNNAAKNDRNHKTE